ncbi:MAG: hypothetical protein ACD_75C00434G0004 [uncultured bacterium]|nr:MAG: hypothetical protein ACD_75C00434G0004 [uncultured bacterium]
MSCRYHLLIIGIMSAKSVNGHLCSTRSFSGNAHSSEACSKRSTSLCKVFSANYFTQLIERLSNKAVPRCIDSELLKSACYPSPVKQLMTFCAQKVNSTSNSPKDCFAILITKAQISFQPSLNMSCKDFRHQIRNIIWIIFNSNIGNVDLAKQVRCIEHQ